jgi:hypothetical protein
LDRKYEKINFLLPLVVKLNATLLNNFMEETTMHERSRNLLECHIAGFTYYDGLDVIKYLELGTQVNLKSESDNPYDPNAVAIYYEDTKLGFIPRVKNHTISQLLYFGNDDLFEARINCCHPDEDPENQFRIVVKIKDCRN